MMASAGNAINPDGTTSVGLIQTESISPTKTESTTSSNMDHDVISMDWIDSALPNPDDYNHIDLQYDQFSTQERERPTDTSSDKTRASSKSKPQTFAIIF